MPQLLLQGSLRYDDPADFAGETSTRLGASYELNPLCQRLSTGARATNSPVSLPWDTACWETPILKPETSTGWDAGLGWQSTESCARDATYFSTTSTTLSTSDPNNFTNVNRNEVRTSGVELQAAWSAHTELDSAGAQATYGYRCQGQRISNGQAAVESGRFMPGGNSSPNWLALLDYQWTGDQLASSLHTGKRWCKASMTSIALTWRCTGRLCPH